MGIFALDLKEAVIKPTLIHLKQWTPATEALLLGTAATMSDFGDQHYSDQHNPLFGLYRINKDTHRDIWDNYLAFDSDLASSIRGFASQHMFLENPEHELITNLAYATAIAWATYDAKKCEFPIDANNYLGLANHWFDQYPHGLAASERNTAIDTFISCLQNVTIPSDGKPQLAA